MFPQVILYALLLFATEQVELLGDDHFDVRQKANRHLSYLVSIAPKPIIDGSRSNDPEIARRCTRILKHHRRVLANTILPTHAKRLPWLDSLPADVSKEWRERQQMYLDMAHEEHGDNWHSVSCPPDWIDYRRATYYMVRDLLDGGWTARQVIDLLDRMVLKDIEICKRMKWIPP